MTLEALGDIHVFDVIVLATVLVTTLVSYSRGFVRSFFSFAGWVAGALAVIYGFRYLEPFIRQYVSVADLARLAAGAILFVGGMLLVALLSRPFVRMVADSEHSAVDRALGILFGLAKGALIVGLAYMVFTWAFSEDDLPEWVVEARSYPAVRAVAYGIEQVLPPDLIDEGRVGAERADRAVRDAERLRRLHRDIVDPQPDTGDADGAGNRYDEADRERLDSLIRGTK